MEPVTLGTTIVKGIETGASILWKVGKFFRDVHQAPHAIQRMNKEIEHVKLVLEELNRFALADHRNETAAREISVQKLATLIVNTVDILADLLVETNLLKGPSNFNYWDQVAWVAWEEKPLKLVQNLQNNMTYVNTLLSLSKLDFRGPQFELEAKLQAMNERFDLLLNRTPELSALLSEGYSTQTINDSLDDILSTSRVYVRANEVQRDSSQSWASANSRARQSWAALADLRLSDVSRLSVIELPFSLRSLDMKTIVDSGDEQHSPDIPLAGAQHLFNPAIKSRFPVQRTATPFLDARQRRHPSPQATRRIVPNHTAARPSLDVSSKLIRVAAESENVIHSVEVEAEELLGLTVRELKESQWLQQLPLDQSTGVKAITTYLPLSNDVLFFNASSLYRGIRFVYPCGTVVGISTNPAHTSSFSVDVRIGGVPRRIAERRYLVSDTIDQVTRKLNKAINFDGPFEVEAAEEFIVVLEHHRKDGTKSGHLNRQKPLSEELAGIRPGEYATLSARDVKQVSWKPFFQRGRKGGQVVFDFLTSTLRRLPKASADTVISENVTHLRLPQTPAFGLGAFLRECSWSRLNSLSLPNMSLTEFPMELLAITSLKSLHLDRNLLRELPSDIHHLTKLETLTLYLNELNLIPIGIHRMHRLRSIMLYGNPTWKYIQADLSMHALLVEDDDDVFTRYDSQKTFRDMDELFSPDQLQRLHQASFEIRDWTRRHWKEPSP